MDRMIRSTSPWGQSGVISDALVWVEIAYLDSAADYREFLPENGGKKIRKSRSLITRKRLLECAALAGTLVIALGMVAIGWFFG